MATRGLFFVARLRLWMVMMFDGKTSFIVLNVVGGVAVLGSYALCIVGWPEESPLLWGAIPPSIIPVYTANMFVAAFGFFLFSWRVLRWCDVDSSQFVGGRTFKFLIACYAAMLIGSALWMPLSLYAVVNNLGWLTPFIVVDLGIVAVGSLGILVCMITMTPQGSRASRVASIVGACLFCSQTVLLDFCIWPWFFSV